MTFLFGCLVTASITMQALAQQPLEHEFIRGDMPPGVAARFYQMGDPALRGHVQAVQLVAPENTIVEIGDAQSSFGHAQAEQMTVNMGIGYVYRFKLSNLPLPDAAGKTLYPSIEVIGKLNPPPGLESDFPIQVVVTRDDIEIALAGRMVTRVIYLEDPRGTLPHLHTVSDQPTIDVRRGQDPLRAAEQMGRPMAILRMGSRVPMEGEVAEWFTFGIAAPTVLPNPRAVNHLGLSEHELRIVDEMRQAEAAAKAAAEAEIVAAINKEKLADELSLPALNPYDSTPDAYNIDAVADADPSDSDPIVESFADTPAPIPPPTTTPIAPDPPKAKKPKWIKVKATAKLKPSTRPNMESMNSIRAFSSAAKKAKPPAPSMVGLDFAPVDQGFKEPPRAYPVIRRPNQLNPN